MNPRLRRIASVVLVALLPGPLLAQGTYMGQAEVVRQAPPIASPPGAYPAPNYGAPTYPSPNYDAVTYPPPNYGAPTYAPQQGAPAAFSQEQLDGLLAPIALYPDQLLAQVLMAATFPLDVVEAARFVQQNPNLKGPALDNALASRPWDPSVLSLAAFPQVLQMMNDRLDWTRELGDAFLADQDRVMQTVQDLRQRAQSAGNLVDTPQQRVIVENRAIYIEPVQPEVIYVPYYNPTVVYGSWWAPAYVPFYWRPSTVAVIGGGVVAFSGAYYVTRNHWGWARPDWRSRHIAIDFNRGNYFIERRPYYRQWVRDGAWQHRGDRFRDSRWGRPAPRAPAPSAAQNPNGRWEGRGRGEAPRGEASRPERPRAVAPAEWAIPRGEAARTGNDRSYAHGDNPGSGPAPRAAPGRAEGGPAGRAAPRPENAGRAAPRAESAPPPRSEGPRPAPRAESARPPAPRVERTESGAPAGAPGNNPAGQQ